MKLVQGLLHSIGIKASTRRLSELFRLVEQYCHWFQYQTKLQLNLKEWKIIQKELTKQHQKGNVIPLKLRTLCNAITLISEILLQTLAFENANTECKRISGTFPPCPPAVPPTPTLFPPNNSYQSMPH